MSEDHPPVSVIQKEEEEEVVVVQNILETCDAHDIDVDDEANDRSLPEDEGVADTSYPSRRVLSKRETILGSLVRNHQLERSVETSQENDIIREIRQMIEKGPAGKLPFQVRVMNGSYTVELPMVPPSEMKKKGGKQSIPTVANSGPFYKLLHHGCRKQETVSKVIMEGIDLCLEGGKTYLVLGGPGSGKSTRT